MAAYSIWEDLCSDQGLQLTFNYLLPVIQAHSDLTYGEIAERLGKDLKIAGTVSPRHIGHVAGTLMDRIQAVYPSAPLLNVLVVVDTQGQPGTGADGYLQTRFSLSGSSFTNRRRRLVTRAAEEVYAFELWPQIYRRLFRRNAPPSDTAALISGTEVDGDPPPTTGNSGPRFGGQAESTEHKKLKEYVRTHPQCIGGAPRQHIAEKEKLLLSGDKVDVFFEMDHVGHLVEVKSIRSTEPDLRRGVYQCIKYRAVFRAQCQRTMPDLRLKAVLVTETSPSIIIRSLAKQHGVHLAVVPVNRRRCCR